MLYRYGVHSGHGGIIVLNAYLLAATLSLGADHDFHPPAKQGAVRCRNTAQTLMITEELYFGGGWVAKLWNNSGGYGGIVAMSMDQGYYVYQFQVSAACQKIENYGKGQNTAYADIDICEVPNPISWGDDHGF